MVKLRQRKFSKVMCGFFSPSFMCYTSIVSSDDPFRQMEDYNAFCEDFFVKLYPGLPQECKHKKFYCFTRP